MPVVSNFSNLSGTTHGGATIVTMDLKFSLDKNHEATYKFTKNEIAAGQTSNITIKLVPDLTQDPLAFSAYIEGYCSTDIDPGNVAVIEHETTTPGTKVSVSKSMIAQLKAYPANTNKIVFEVVLQERQLVIIGVIVAVIFKDGSIKRYLCDPQVGNGPPPENGLMKALPVI